MSKYAEYRSEMFSKQYKGLTKKDRPLAKQLDQAIADIISDPGNFDSSLKADRKRSVKKKAVKERYRIIYRYCERCIQVHGSRCADCVAHGFPVESVILEEVFNRDSGY